MSGLITSNFFSNCVQNSAFQVLSEGSMKAVGRPVFTVFDKHATPEQKKYSALKELTFQVASMALYFAAVMTVVKGGGYKALRKMPVFKDMDVCQKFSKFGGDKGFISAFDGIEEQVRKGKKVDAKTLENFRLTKGAMELITMIGSGVILTILCPMIVSKKLVHPVMEKYEQMQANKKAQTQNIDKVA